MTRIALFQSTTGIDPAANTGALGEAIAEAADGGAEMLFTPEMSGLLDRDLARAAKNLRHEDEDELLSALPRRRSTSSNLASPRLARGAGGQRQGREPRISSSTVKAKSGRATTSSTCSTSTFPPARAGANSSVYSAGSGVVLVNGTPVGKLGLTICYDLRFPGLFARLAEANADIIAVPAAFTVPTGKAHWHILLRARAIEAGLFVVAAAQVGRHEDGRQTFGHSLVVDPWGDVLLDMGDGTGVGFADIDLKRISDVRGRIPALNHRRPIPDAVSL